MKRWILAFLALFCVGCTPAQLDYFGVHDPQIREALLALPDKTFWFNDGSSVDTDGKYTPAPTYEEVGETCPQWIPLLVEHAPTKRTWDPARMARIMWRESRCFAHIRSRTSDTGLLQINDVNHRYLREQLGEWVDRWTLQDPVQNIRAAAVLFEYDGYGPWGG